VVLVLGLCAALGGCEDAECTPRRAVVTDIDETLTTGDIEWVWQTSDPDYDPVMRPDADALMAAYADAGYSVIYITARSEQLLLPDGRTAREATRDWLVAHGFPYVEEQLFLAWDLMVHGDAAVTYKADVIAELIADGWTVDYGYGNADSDIEAFLQAGIPADRVFLVGRLAESLAGPMGVRPLPGDEAYTGHLDSFFPTVPPPSCD